MIAVFLLVTIFSIEVLLLTEIHWKIATHWHFKMLRWIEMLHGTKNILNFQRQKHRICILFDERANVWVEQLKLKELLFIYCLVGGGEGRGGEFWFCHDKILTNPPIRLCYILWSPLRSSLKTMLSTQKSSAAPSPKPKDNYLSLRSTHSGVNAKMWCATVMLLLDTATRCWFSGAMDQRVWI